MGIGILEPTTEYNIMAIPGTCLFDTLEPIDGEVGLRRHPKHPDVILRPQPSDSMDDPLNWLVYTHVDRELKLTRVMCRSRIRKELYFASLIAGAVVAGVIGPILVPALKPIIEEYPGTGVDQFVALTGYLVLTYGISSYLGVCLSDKFGRRPTSLVSHALMMWGIIWAARGRS
jgi:hypothetical protein